MFYYWINEKDEEFLLEKFNISPGELYSKINLADWLLYGCSELSKLLGSFDIQKHFDRLRLRVNYGVKEELLSLVKLQGIGRKRARKLFNTGIKSMKDIKKSDVGVLVKLIGKKRAFDIMAKFMKINKDIMKKDFKKKKLKGQTNIEDFR